MGFVGDSKSEDPAILDQADAAIRSPRSPCRRVMWLEGSAVQRIYGLLVRPAD
jgi:hypothetical protein